MNQVYFYDNGEDLHIAIINAANRTEADEYLYLRSIDVSKFTYIGQCSKEMVGGNLFSMLKNPVIIREERI